MAFDWSRNRERQRAHKRGTERAGEHPSFMRPLIRRRPPVRRQTKAELRAETERLVAEWLARRSGSDGSQN